MFVQVLQGGVEVARVEFDDPGGINPECANVPQLGIERLEIQFIEVATAARGRGVGTAVVRALEETELGPAVVRVQRGRRRFLGAPWLGTVLRPAARATW